MACETHFRAEVENNNIIGYAVSKCGDTVLPVALSFHTDDNGAIKALGALFNDVEVAAGRETWQSQACSFLLYQEEKKLSINACMPTENGDVKIEGVTYHWKVPISYQTLE